MYYIKIMNHITHPVHTIIECPLNLDSQKLIVNVVINPLHCS